MAVSHEIQALNDLVSSLKIEGEGDQAAATRLDRAVWGRGQDEHSRATVELGNTVAELQDAVGYVDPAVMGV